MGGGSSTFTSSGGSGWTTTSSYSLPATGPAYALGNYTAAQADSILGSDAYLSASTTARALGATHAEPATETFAARSARFQGRDEDEDEQDQPEGDGGEGEGQSGDEGDGEGQSGESSAVSGSGTTADIGRFGWIASIVSQSMIGAPNDSPVRVGLGGTDNAATNPHLAGQTPQPGSRRTGVNRAIALEVELVRRTGQGTIAGGWSADEVAHISRTGRLPDGIEGHHINDVRRNATWAGDPRSIRFVRGRQGNLELHDGGRYQGWASGPLIDRQAMIDRARAQQAASSTPATGNVHTTGPARAEAAGRPRLPAGRIMVRGIRVLSVYTDIRDLLREAGIARPPERIIEADYYFVSEDGSVFIVQVPGMLNFFGSPRRLYVAGPRRGESETITNAQVDEHRRQAEAIWGRLIRGGIFPWSDDDRFEPGTERRTLPIVDEYGRRIGYIDETGRHHYSPRWIGPIQA